MTADLTKSAALDQHLKDAIAEFSPLPKAPDMARGLLRLKALSETLLASIDKQADAAADELQKNHDEAVAAVQSVKEQIAAPMKSAVAEVKDMLNQISNGDPTA